MSDDDFKVVLLHEDASGNGGSSAGGIASVLKLAVCRGSLSKRSGGIRPSRQTRRHAI